MDLNNLLSQLLIGTLLRIEYLLEAYINHTFHKLNNGSVAKRMEKYSGINIIKAQPLAELNDRVAIFVGYHSSSDIPVSNWNYIQALREAGFKIFYIHNGRLDSITINQLSQICDQVVCRPNLGSDCGAWKDAYLYFYSKGYFVRTEWILFCNDSNVFLAGENGDSFINKFKKFLLDAEHDLIALNKNYELWQHYQSFFLCIRSTIFNTREFNQFWKNYLPLTHRFHAINNCEIKLTKRILSKYSAAVIYDVSTLYERISLEDRITAAAFLSFLPKNAMYLSGCVGAAHVYELELQKILAVLACHNPSHGFALLFVEYLKSPFLKKDLVRQGVFSIPQVQSTVVRHVTKKEFKPLVKEIMDGYLSAGLNSSYLKYPRLAYRKGINAYDGSSFNGYGQTLKRMGLS